MGDDFDPWNDGGNFTYDEYQKRRYKEFEEIIRKNERRQEEQLELPVGNQVMVQPKPEPVKEYHNCWANWVNVGFHHDKFVCKICDKEKE